MGPARKVRWGLKNKLTVSIVVVGGLPLIFGMGMAYYQSTQELREMSGTSFAGIASESGRKLDVVFSEEIIQTSRIASDPMVIQALEERHRSIRDLDKGKVQTLLKKGEARWKARDTLLIQDVTNQKLANLLKRYFTGQQDASAQSVIETKQSPTRALFLTDSKGELVASISENVPYLNAGESWWQGAYNAGHGQPYWGNVYFDERLGVYALALSLPVMDKIHFQTVGVLHRVFQAKDYISPTISPIRFGKTGHVMLIDSEGIVMSCPILPTGARLSDQELIRLVTQPQGGWVKAPGDGHGSHTISIIGFSPLSLTSHITKRSTGRQWYTFVWQSSDELFAPMQHLFTWISIFGLGAIGILGLMGYVTAGRIVKPIRRLQEGAMLIAQGELREPIKVETGDEIEQLADEFNRMNIQLQQTFSGLQVQVEEKSQEVLYLQEYNEQILQRVPNPIILFDLDERIEYVNNAAREALNLKDGMVGGSSLSDLFCADKPSAEKLRGELRNYVKSLENQDDLFDKTHKAWKQPRDPLAQDPAAGKDYSRKELRIGSATYHYVWFHIGTHFGERKRIGLVLRDTTEENRLQEQIIQAEKLASLDVLTSGIGHELNNPLFSIMSKGEAILDEEDIPKIKQQASHIVEQAKQMSRIIRDFSGQIRAAGKDLYVEVDINQQLDQALRIVGLADSVEGLEVKKDYKPLPKIQASPEEIVQIFVNVIKNGIQAMKGKGILRLITYVEEGKIMVEICDSGPGIPQAFVSRIFEPFFTTKGPGQGTGLGLTIAHRIITKYEGQIYVGTKKGEGTAFILSFPVLKSGVFVR